MTTDLSIAPGVTLHAMKTEKFKTACFSVNFLRPHAAETVSLDVLLPSVLLRGTQRYPDIQSISVRMDELYGATFGTLTRRKGEIRLIGFFADFIEDDFLPEGEGVFAPMVEFLDEVLYHPQTENGVFGARSVEGEKQNLINAIDASINSKSGYAMQRMLERMCAGEAYGLPRLGYAEGVRAITPEALWAHYQNVLRTSRIEIFYAGRRSAEDAAAQFSRVFAGRQPAELTPVATQVIRQAGQRKELVETTDAKQGNLAIGLRTGITASDPDYPALLLLNVVLGAGSQSKLFVNVREKLSLCYYAATRIEKYKGIMTIASGIANENYETAKQAILHEIDACKAGEISQDELETARRQLLSSIRSSEDSLSLVDEFYVGLALTRGDDFPALEEKIRRLTRDELQRAAQKLSVDTIYFLKGEER